MSNENAILSISKACFNEIFFYYSCQENINCSCLRTIAEAKQRNKF